MAPCTDRVARTCSPAPVRVVALVVAASGRVCHASGPSVEYEHRFSEWSSCSDACGIGSRTRRVDCIATLAHKGRVFARRVSSSRCADHRVPKLSGALRQTCYGTATFPEYCVSCGDGKGRCLECAPGFDLRDDGSCKNSGLVVLLDFELARPPTGEWQRKWRARKLSRCIGRLVEVASGIREPRASIHVAAPSATRRAAATRRAGLVRAAVLVPQSVSAGVLQAALRFNISRAVGEVASAFGRPVLGDEICPAGLLLIVSAVLCPGALPPDSRGSCRDPVATIRDRALSVVTWCGVGTAVFVVGALVFFWRERRYRLSVIAGALEARMVVQMEVR